MTYNKISKLLAEARASEQDKAKAIQILAFEQGIAQDKAKAIQILAFEQGIAEGYNHGQASVMATCSDCQKVQRKIGRDELIEKLKRYFKSHAVVCSSDGTNNYKDTWQDAIKKASESAFAASFVKEAKGETMKHKHRWIAETAISTPFCEMCGKDKPEKRKVK